MNPATVIAANIIDEMLRCGVTDVVIAPGSRNAPLSIAVVSAADEGRVRLHTRIDERSAAFLALGLAKASGRASAVITTSGTAAANLHPAVLEASHSDVPLLVLTADRPIELRGTGANQTTDQQYLFGRAVRHFAEVGEVNDEAFIRSAISRAVHCTSTGPVHINVPLREPLVGEGAAGPGRPGDLPWTTVMETFPQNFDISLDLPSRGVVVVAHDYGVSAPEIDVFAQTLGWPVICEDVLDFPHAIGHAALFLAEEKVRQSLRPDMAIVVGRPVLSRSIAALIRESQRVVVVDPSHLWSDPQRVAELVLPTLPMPEGDIDPSWLASWRTASTKAAQVINQMPRWSEGAALARFAAELPSEAALFVGASRPIRDLEAFAAPRSGVRSYSNRGLAGIDGSVSTAIGVALATDLRTFAVLGDLTFLHDINGLLIPTTDQVPDLTFLVVDNNGGGIFSTLPQRDVDSFDRIFGTPHDRSIAEVARAYGAEVVEVSSQEDLASALKGGKGIRVVVATMPPRTANAEMLRNLKFN